MNANQLHILLHVGLAMLLGAIIGVERELEHKPAGLRTHMLVAGSAALLVALADVVVSQVDIETTAALTTDPIRIIQAVITGVSFLGAGTIIRQQSKGVEGLTTAASVLFVAAVGVTIALEQYLLGIGLTIIVLATLRGLGIVERRWM